MDQKDEEKMKKFNKNELDGKIMTELTALRLKTWSPTK